jgi:hypothetical protein
MVSEEFLLSPHSPTDGHFHCHKAARARLARLAVRFCCVPVVAAVVLLGASGVSAASLPKLTPSEKSKLQQWKSIVKIDKSSRYWVPKAYLLMSAPPSKVMGVVMDIASYHEFMPRVTKSRVVRRKGKRNIWAVIVTNLPWPMRNAWVAVKYTWSKPSNGHYRLDWIRHRGSMSQYWGRLDLYRWGKHFTLAVCSMQAVPDQYITRSKLNEGIVWGAEQLLQSVRARLDALRRFATLKSWMP